MGFIINTLSLSWMLKVGISTNKKPVTREQGLDDMVGETSFAFFGNVRVLTTTVKDGDKLLPVKLLDDSIPFVTKNGVDIALPKIIDPGYRARVGDAHRGGPPEIVQWVADWIVDNTFISGYRSVVPKMISRVSLLLESHPELASWNVKELSRWLNDRKLMFSYIAFTYEQKMGEQYKNRRERRVERRESIAANQNKYVRDNFSGDGLLAQLVNTPVTANKAQYGWELIDEERCKELGLKGPQPVFHTSREQPEGLIVPRNLPPNLHAEVVKRMEGTDRVPLLPGYHLSYLHQRDGTATNAWSKQPWEERPSKYRTSSAKCVFAQATYIGSINFNLSHYNYKDGYLYTYVVLPNNPDYVKFYQFKFCDESRRATWLPPVGMSGNVSMFLYAPNSVIKYDLVIRTKMEGGRAVEQDLVLV